VAIFKEAAEKVVFVLSLSKHERLISRIAILVPFALSLSKGEWRVVVEKQA
jgi:hypothetical protein